MIITQGRTVTATGLEEDEDDKGGPGGGEKGRERRTTMTTICSNTHSIRKEGTEAAHTPNKFCSGYGYVNDESVPVHRERLTILINWV